MKTLTRLLIFILAIPSLLFLTSCPHELEKNPDVPGYIDADFIGVWKCIDDSEIYYLLLDPYGAGKWVNEDLDDDEITSTSIDWYYNDGSLTVRFPKFTEKYVVVKLTESLMILGDKWGELTFRRIKASDIPEYKPGGDDPNDPDSPNDNPNDDKTDGQIKTVSAEPSAFSAVVSGIYSGKTAPDYVGVQYSYYKDFPESQSATRSIEGRLGEYQVKATGIVDQVKVYYRAYAVIGDQYIYGETKSFQTPQGTYTLNGTTYKFIKVTGLATGSFSMMQTELPADADITIDGTEINCIDYYKKNGYVEAGEIQGFLCESCEGVTPLLRYPSREEWLFAFSGGSLSNGYKYSGSNDIGEVAWYSANSNDHAREPGQKKSNELGFYDMSGNYAELCSSYSEEILESFKEKGIKKFVLSVRSMSAQNFYQLWYNAAAYGGCWSSSASDCQSFSTVSGFDPKTNRFNGNKFAVRLAYSRPD